MVAIAVDWFPPWISGNDNQVPVIQQTNLLPAFLGIFELWVGL
jgi:hypothetical protein